MERRYHDDVTRLTAFDALQSSRYLYSQDEDLASIVFKPNQAYAKYHRHHKVLVGEGSVDEMVKIHHSLRGEEMPNYLDVSAWAAVEAALVGESMNAVDRIALLEGAEDSWRRAIDFQEIINHTDATEHLQEYVASYRLAVNLAFAPVLKALVLGNVTDVIRQKAFVDVLSIAQAAGVQRTLALKAGSIEVNNDFLGFEHECNAYLAVLAMDDARYVPLPSSARGGSGYDYPNQTHDLIVLSQHYGEIRNVVPVEVKAKASLNDIKRYDALIVRGKMHLSVTGKYTPEYTRDSLANFFEGTASIEDNKTVYQVISTFKDLLRLYKTGKVVTGFNTRTKFHDTDKLTGPYPEFSLNRPHSY